MTDKTGAVQPAGGRKGAGILAGAARYLGEPGPVPRDVDVLAVGTASDDDLYEAAHRAELRLEREVNISGVSPQYWENPDPADYFMRHVRERPLVKLELSA